MLKMFVSNRILPICLMLYVILAMISVNGYTIGNPIDKLTKCSKFDFEEKLLEKLVRLEHSVELERKLKQFEDMLSEKLMKMESINSEKMQEMENRMNVIIKRLDEEDVRRKGTFKTLKDELTGELSRQKEALVEVIQNFTVSSDDVTNKIVDKHNALLNVTKHENENQKMALAEVMYDIKLNTSLSSERLLDQQKKNEDILLSFMQEESSKNRVSLSVCAQFEKYNSGSKILFPYIHIQNGISSHVISALKDTGIYTCEKPGLYLISIFMMTNEHRTMMYLYKNESYIALLYFSLNGHFQTSSASVLVHLSTGDMLTVRTGDTMHVYVDRHSCMSILQITR